MSLYPAASEEAHHARNLLKHWTDEHVLTEAQHQDLLQQTPCDLRTCNLFLRLVLFLFTLLGVAAAIALCLIGPNRSDHSAGILCLVFAVACYIAAEVLASQARLYRYGVEEALLASATVLLFVGLLAVCDVTITHRQPIDSLIPATSALFCLWIRHRFGLWYATPAAMIFAALLPAFWTTSPTLQHVILAAIYGAGLFVLINIRARQPSDPPRNPYALAEGLLWLSLYLTVNLKVFALGVPVLGWFGASQSASDVSRPFYWLTWVLIWCLPALILAKGIRQKDRFLLQFGTLTAILTLISNKPYLGWERHSWDPMLLGIVLVGVVLWLRRWLAQGPQGVRHGFTVAPLTARDQRWMSTGSAVIGLSSPQAKAQPHEDTANLHPGGGASGGAGASRNF